MIQRHCSLLFAFFLLGAYSTAVQVLLIREFLVILFGNELCLGVIFAAWLLAIYLGSRLGALLVSRFVNPQGPFILLLGLLACVPTLQIILIRHLRLFLQLGPGELVPFFSMFGSVCVLIFPFTFLIGFIFPFASLVSLSFSAGPLKAAPRVYVCESWGSTVSGISLAFWLLPRFSPLQIIAFLSMLVLLVALSLAYVHQSPPWRSRLMLFPAVLTLLWAAMTGLGLWSFLETNTTAQRWRSLNPQMSLLASTNTHYQNLVAATLQGQYSIYGNGQHLASFPDSFQAAQQAHFLLTQHPHPKNVLLVGGGLTGILTHILTHPVSALHYVELDPLLLSFASPYLSPPDSRALRDPRVRLISTDGRHYVRHCRETYDLVIVLVPDPSTAMLNRFYTVEFFREAARILAPRGLFITSLTASADYVGHDIGRYTASVYHSLLRVFPQVLIAPGARTYFFAAPLAGVATVDPNVLSHRFLERGIVTPHFSSRHFPILLHPERRDFLTQALHASPLPPLNTDSRPIAYFYNFILWDFFSGGQAGQFFRPLEPLTAGTFVLVLAGIVIFRLLYCVVRTRTLAQETRFNALLAIGAVGYSAMGLQIILLFSYQNIYGCLYQKVGLLIALCMAGLALGAWLTNLAIARLHPDWTRTLISLHFAIATLAALLLPLVSLLCASPALGPFAGETIFLFLVVLAGMLTGAAFPVVNCTLMATDLTVGKAAALSNAYDHLGACLGAALTGTILVPLLGTAPAALLIAGINLSPLLLLAFSLLARKRASTCSSN